MKSRIHDAANETMPRAELHQLQLERLQSTIHRTYRNVQFYGAVMREAGLTPDDFTSLDDLRRLPLTTKTDLRESYPYAMFAVPLREVRRIHSSSGSTGVPTVVGYTANDLEHWTELVARNLAAAGVNEDDVVQIFFGYGMFSGGFGLHQGAERVGASVLPASTAEIHKQIAVMQDFRTTVLVGTPSYARQIAETITASEVSAQSLSVRVGLFGGEQWTERTRQIIEDKLLITALDIYGLAELGGPGVAGECEHKCGLHIAEDHFIPEVIDPDTGERLDDGEEGELVLTAIDKEAFPLLRYRTGDITSLTREACQCGRTHARMSRVLRRTDDMIIIQGMKVFPGDIQAIVETMEGVAGPRMQVVLNRDGGEDTMEVQIELSRPPAGGRLSELDRQRHEAEELLRKRLGLGVRVKFVEPTSLAPLGEKTSAVVDKREL
jgi:phenylacetate-CoA ligase